MPSAIDALIGKAFDAYGDKPNVPWFVQTNLTDEQNRATAANVGAFSGIAGLGARVNAFNTSELQKMYEKMVPGYGQMMGQGSQLIQSYMRGEIPSDVQQQIARSSAERSLAGGYGGSGMARNLEARDLGLTSLQLTQQGLSSAERWLASSTSRTPGLFNVASMFVTPQQSIQLTQENRGMDFQRNWLQSQIDAMPSPYGQALAQGISGDLGSLSSAAGSAAGGGGGSL